MPGNTISGSLITKTLSKVASATTGSKLAPFATFCTPLEVAPDEISSRATEIPVCTVAPATQTDATNFETGDSTVANITATMHCYSQTFGLSAADISNGARLDWLFTKNVEALADKLSDVIMELINEANFGAPVVTNVAESFGVADFDTLFSAIATPNRAIVLNTPYFARVKSTWLPVGFTNVQEVSRWTTAGTNLQGFVASPRSILLRHGLPIDNVSRHYPGAVREVFTIPGVSIPGEVITWVLPGTRNLRCAVNVYLGAAVADAAGLKLLKSV